MHTGLLTNGFYRVGQTDFRWVAEWAASHGFKEIEIGFPAASQIEYDFLRQLAERRLIPDDVRVQVLVQCREHLIKRTFEAVKGAPHAVIHVYNSTSVAQREQVFRKDQEQVKQIAIDGAKLLKELAEEKGIGIILISSEMDEVKKCSNRIIALYEGRQAGEYDAAADKDTLLSAIIGVNS